MKWILVALVLCTSVAAHEGHEPEEEAPPQPANLRELYRPSKNPDRMILTWTSDPATSQAVTWRTDVTVKRGLAEVVIAGSGPAFGDDAPQVIAKTTVLRADLSTSHYHTAEFTNLQPETKYAYRVGDGVNWSEWSHFVTASRDAKPFSFLYFGDAQNSLKTHWSRVIRQAYSDAPQARFLLHAGDLVSMVNNDAEWGAWFYAGGWINRSIPSIATPGNHEYFEGIFGLRKNKELTAHWRPMFAFPLNGPQGLEETTYYIDYQGARIISLNSNLELKKQTVWLENVLSEAVAKKLWIIVTMHHPVYSSREGRDNPAIRNAWQPLFDRYGADLVLQGHDHTYARSKLVTANTPVGRPVFTPTAGTVYVVSVSGPKMYILGEKDVFQKTAANLQLYQIIKVDGDEIQYEARTAVGDLYDAFTLKRQPGKPNQLINRIPQEK